MDAAWVFVIFWGYSLFVYLVKRYLYLKMFSGELYFERAWIGGCEITIFFSPDYWWARRFKFSLSQAVPAKNKAELRREYVLLNNKLNIWLSVVLTLACFAARYLFPNSSVFYALVILAVIRFISRSVEIFVAFGLDVVQKEASSTGLKKEERIKLALVSYFEIYIYSAAAYLVLPVVPNAYEAIILSLNVGTLMNVGYVYSSKIYGCLGGGAAYAVNMVFVQVFSTLSLVVLSLAAYLGRKK